MRPVPEDTPGQISFGSELLRKGTHMGALVIPGGYFILGLEKSTMLTIMIPIALLMLLIDIARLRNWSFWRNFASKITGKMVRGHEKAGDFTGATYILLSVCATVALFSKPIAVAALAFIIVGDTLAALVGRKIGRLKFGHKTVEGTLACLVGTIAVACFVALFVPGLPLKIGIIGAVVATITEAFSFGIDDNVSVPLVSGLVMSLLVKFLVADAVFE